MPRAHQTSLADVSWRRRCRGCRCRLAWGWGAFPPGAGVQPDREDAACVVLVVVGLVAGGGAEDYVAAGVQERLGVVAACVGAATASAPAASPTVARPVAMIVPRVISSQSVDVACPPQYIGPCFQIPFMAGWLGLYSGGRGLACGFIMIGNQRGT